MKASPTSFAAAAAPLSAAARDRHGRRLMVAGGLLLGTLGVFLEEAGQDPLTAVWFRSAFGALALLLWGAATGRLGELRLHGTGWAAALGAGLLMMLNWVLFFGAISRTSIGVATVVFHVQPIWVMVLAAWWLRERISTLQWWATLAALAGLALAIMSPSEREAIDAAYAWGLAMCLGGSLSYAGVTLIAKSVRNVSSFALAWWQCMVGVLVLLWWPFVHGWPAAGAAWAWLAGLGVLHTGLAYVLLYQGMASLSAGRIAVLQFVYPAAAVLIDWLVYGRALGPGQLCGVAIMAAAIWTVRRPAASADERA